MTYEVELKFPLKDRDTVVALLRQLKAEPGRAVAQQDRYFNHPTRDFALTDEALRIRSVDEGNCVTYKGPLVDAQTKTRREIEIPFGTTHADAQRYAELLGLLGFQEVRTVTKTRMIYRLDWEQHAVEVALDDVEDLGPFLEIETLADEANRDAARDCILRLAARLGLEHSQRKSYLALLLERDNEQSSVQT